MDVLTYHEACKLAESYPSGLDVFDKLYPVSFDLTLANLQIPEKAFIKFNANAWFFLYAITASFADAGGGRAVTKADSPKFLLTDTRNGKPLSGGGSNNIAASDDGYMFINGNFSPGLITEPLTNNNLVYIHEFFHLFAPLSQLRVDVLNPSGLNLECDILFKGFVIREGKV